MTSNEQTPSAQGADGLVKLFKVPRNSRIKFNGVELSFHHVDGAYSLCSDDEGNYVHLAAWTEVEIVKEPFDED